TNNVGGIDKVTHDGVNTGSITTHLSGAALADFLETTPEDIAIFGIAADSAGNLYFNNTDSSPDRRGIYQLDTEGRLSKVMGHAERIAISGGSNSQMLRMQPRTVSYEGPNGAYDVTQILFADSN